MGSFPTDVSRVTATRRFATLEADVLIIPVFEADKTEEAPETKSAKKSAKKAESPAEQTLRCTWPEALDVLDKATEGSLHQTLVAEKFSGDCGKKRVFFSRPQDGIKARWVVVLGLGKPEKTTLKKAIAAYASALKDAFGFDQMHHVVAILPEKTAKISLDQWVYSAVFGAFKATYKTHEAGEEKIHALKKLGLMATKGTLSEETLEQAKAMAQAEAFTKDLANMPANLKRAETLAEAARSLSSLPGVTVQVESDSAVIEKTMPAFWAVAQAAAKADPPRFIKVTYSAPAAKGKTLKKLALVGKGVIFDTGGVQVKTGNYMSDMKFDMTGAASVLGAVQAAAQLGLKGIEVSAYVAATANLIGETAYLPDSIIQSASGKRIEINHTDAEGRVTLADAVYKAAEDNPDCIVTIATLTGSASTAVGHGIALMGTDDDLVKQVEKSAKSVGEAVQALDLWDEDFENIKSSRDAADLSNTGKAKTRGHLSAGAFVISFAKDKPIAHLDIAGGDAKDGNATGIAVKGLVAFLIDQAS